MDSGLLVLIAVALRATEVDVLHVALAKVLDDLLLLGLLRLPSSPLYLTLYGVDHGLVLGADLLSQLDIVVILLLNDGLIDVRGVMSILC